MSWPDIISPRPLEPASRTLHRVPWPTGEEQAGPIDLDDAKEYARITSTVEDILAADMLAGAIGYAETATRRTIAFSLWDLVLDSFPAGGIELRRPPVVDVEEVQYRNAADAWVVIDALEYEVEIDGDRATVGPLAGESWPGVSALPRSVRIRYRAGYRPYDYEPDVYSETPPFLPANLKSAICELFTFRFDYRGDTNGPPANIDAALWSERVDL